ncbi:hypothetical protein Phum_PHUM596200 [Pediculus humanus corporis]|uniref:Uncharacterized protein n=1 Tax=Pediculus humanus subsp. corporis TaxID=121224 RepID=E0W2N8_PEDHC|nr:uncharacterized protein Phum_PHUM596200 [Pediculus humanus corporis]EEB19894.1 hypothetical protein Phum_PHUM596200 [Pediculus humanus corporis]
MIISTRGPVGIREVPFELFSVSRQLDLRDKPLDFESQPFPHQLLPNYTQTILLPITIKNISAEGSPESSRCTTPGVVPEPKIDTKNEDYIEAPSPPHQSIYNYLTVSVSVFFFKIAPLEEILMEENEKPQPETTVSTPSPTKTNEQSDNKSELSIEKLTDMFTATSRKITNTSSAGKKGGYGN